ncbi:MAG: choice-of-anchor I family protein [Bacteroidota bacterium]
MKRTVLKVFISLFIAAVFVVPQSRGTLDLLGTYRTGSYNISSAEIVAHDPATQQLYVIRGNLDTLDIVSIVNPKNPVRVKQVTFKTHYPGAAGANSVAVRNGIVAVAVGDSGVINPQPGKVLFFDTNGTFLNQITVGTLPDMLTFSQSGTKVLVANEGEPNASYTNDPEGSVSIIDISSGVMSATVQHVTFTSLNGQEAQLKAQGIRIYGPNATAAKDFEPEYITTWGDTAWVTLQENNALAIIRISDATLLSVKPLGFKNHLLANNSLDVSDRDNAARTGGAINLANWPVFGMYLPDAIASYRVNGQTYIVTANEGDSRDYAGYAEEARVSTLNLDTIRFPIGDSLKLNHKLGRLTVTKSLGDGDGDGDYDSLFCLGGRSFSIWTASGTLVFDSGNEFEKITSTLYPSFFNVSNTNNTFDSRSTAKGPEPEALTIGTIGDSIYAYIGFERIGGIIVYNITNPAAPKYIQYINNRDFAQTPGAGTVNTIGDLGPEGILFVTPQNSPTGLGLVIVANEISGTVSLFQTQKPVYEAKVDSFVWKNPGMITAKQGINVLEGGFSGLASIPYSPNEFYVVSDRGPNADYNGGIYFLAPSYAPKLHRIKLAGDSVQIISTKELKRPNGSFVSGLPNPSGFGGTGEIAYNDTLVTSTLTPDEWGIDLEGVAIGAGGTLWFCDEYGSSVWNTDANAQILKRYRPFTAADANNTPIDSIFKYRRANRGFEGVARTPNGKIYSIIQSPMYNPSKTAGDNSRIGRLLELDPVSGQTKIYAYVFENKTGSIRLSDWKVGDLAAINNTDFVVVEHAERSASGVFTNKKNLFRISIAGATPIVKEWYTANNDTTLEQLTDSAGLAKEGIVPVKKSHLLDLLANGWNQLYDKPEGIAIENDSTIVVAIDNDFGINAPNADGRIIATGKQSLLYRYTLPAAKKLANFVPLSVISQASVPAEFELSQNYPNPFNPSTTIEVRLPFSGHVEMRVFDILGREVSMLLNQQMQAGNYSVKFDGTSLASGLYLYQLKSGNSTATRKMMLLK